MDSYEPLEITPEMVAFAGMQIDRFVTDVVQHLNQFTLDQEVHELKHWSGPTHKIDINGQRLGEIVEHALNYTDEERSEGWSQLE